MWPRWLLLVLLMLLLLLLFVPVFAAIVVFVVAVMELTIIRCFYSTKPSTRWFILPIHCEGRE